MTDKERQSIRAAIEMRASVVEQDADEYCTALNHCVAAIRGLLFVGESDAVESLLSCINEIADAQASVLTLGIDRLIRVIDESDSNSSSAE